MDLQENVKKLAVKIIKHYRGKGPEYVKVKILDADTIVVDIKGILSNLSEILVNEGAISLVRSYWEIMKPHLEKTFNEEAKELFKRDFRYSWKVLNLENDNRTVVITINLI
ncbi:Na-translocating system protein MpsC family protein [Clostridium yunnanense]|uniref:Na-translocating system protein MpsC family protein n=1 Tax=Clostridium yunnanense TaxID=2800325 RepID=UPI003084026C